MSKNPMLNKEFRFMPSVCDALAFSIKKTIGPLQNKCNTRNKKFLKDLNKYKLISINMKYFIQQLFYSIIHNKKTKNNLNIESDIKELYDYKSQYINNCDDIIPFLECCTSSYSQTFSNIDDNICFNVLAKFFNNIEEELTSKLCICKLYLDLFIEVNMIVDDTKTSENIIENYLSTNNVDDEEDLNIYNLKNLKKKSFFKKILKKIKNDI